MTDMVTRCPACSTSFRITPTQIQKARGAVRCGSCLHIFNAGQHLIAGAVPKAKPAAAKSTPKKTEPAPEQTRLPIDQEVDPQPAAQSAPPEHDGLPFDQRQIDAESASDDDDLLISDDMSGALTGIEPEDDGEDQTYVKAHHNTHSLFDRDLSREEPEFTDSSDESWAEHLLEDDTLEQSRAPEASLYDNPMSIVRADSQPPADEPLAQIPEEALTDEPAIDHSRKVPKPRFHIHADPEDEPEQFHERIKAYSSDRNALLMGIDPEPVEMTVADQRQRRQRLIWAGACVLAILLLFAQIAWLQFDRFSRIEPYRGYYQNLCSVLGCKLPERIDLSRIQSHNLIVRDHPERDNALLVDTILLNKAAFTQPFPTLLLSFSDINNRPIASRRFTPDEYLGGELAGTRLMPRNQQIYLSIEIADPGAEAVNYQLSIP